MEKVTKQLVLMLLVFVVVLTVLSCSGEPEKTALDFLILDSKRNPVDLAQYKGNVVLMVNTATECQLTPQFLGLQKLYDKYQQYGFIILGFPSNSFQQENRSDEEVQVFCSDNFLVNFPLFKKIEVKGPEQHEIYKFLTDPATNPDFPGEITWNFEKFIIGKNGKIVARLAPKVTPEDPELITAIEKALGQR